MTRDEFIEKYGDVVVTFSHYYKYTFTFKTVLPNGMILSVGYGGDHHDIYRYDLVNNEQIRVEDVYPYVGSVYEDGGKVLESFYDY